MKASIVYYSASGNTLEIAKLVQQGLEKAGDIQVKLMTVDEIDKEYLEDSACVIFGTPTYYATMCWQLKKWFDTTKYNLGGKLGACFATANFMGGGSEIAEADMIHHMLVKGMLCYSAGGSQGQPFTHLGAAAIKNGDEFQRERAVIFGERIGRKALELFSR